MTDQTVRLVRIPGGPFISRYKVKCDICGDGYQTLPLEQSEAADEKRRHLGHHAAATVTAIVRDGDGGEVA